MIATTSAVSVQSSTFIWTLLGVLLSGGLLTALGGFAQSLWSERGAERRSKRDHEAAIADRNFQLKKDAYYEGLKEFNLAGNLRFQGVGNFVMSREELSQRNAAITLFDMYATDEVKSKAAVCMQLFQIGPQVDKQKIINALNELSDAIKKDLGV